MANEFLDKLGLKHFWKKIKTRDKTLQDIQSINNAVIQFTNELQVGDLQGNTAFSLSDDYSFDNDNIYFAYIAGTDSDRTLYITDNSGNILSTTPLPNGHYGNLTYYNKKLYSLNYIYSTYGDGKLYVFNVADPSNVTYSTLTPSTLVNGGNNWTRGFNYKDGLFVLGFIENNIIKCYTWDMQNDYNHLVDIPIGNKPISASMAHISYDYKNDLFLLNGNESNTIIVFNSEGKKVNTINIPEYIGFTSSGELEGFNIFGEHIYFGCLYHSSSYLSSVSCPNIIEIFYANINNMASVAIPYSENINIDVDYSLQNGRCHLDNDSNHIIVKYDFQACIVYNNTEKSTNINIVDYYPYEFKIMYLHKPVIINCENESLEAFTIRESSSISINFTMNAFVDDEIGYNYGIDDKLCKMNLVNSQFEFRNHLVKSTENYIAYIANSLASIRNIEYARMRNSFCKCGNISNCSAEVNTIIIATGTVSDNSTSSSKII